MVEGKRFIDSEDVETIELNWGQLKWLSTPEVTGAETFSTGIVILKPGKGHERHTHPDSEEVLYFLSGTGTQTVGSEERQVNAGDAIHIPAGVEHSTINTTWEPLRFLAMYGPPGPETVLRDDPDATIYAAGEYPGQ